jgi:KilA-N domain
MITIVPFRKKYSIASDGKYDLMFLQENEYVNAYRMCMQLRNSNCLDRWRYSIGTKHLYNELQKLGEEPEITDDKTLFIHPTLVPHLAVWFGPQYNYPFLKLLQAITRNTVDKKHEALKPSHTFAFIELSPTGLQRFYALECTSGMYTKRIDELAVQHPQLEVIFLHHQVPNDAHVVDEIRKDFQKSGNICMNHKRFCGSVMAEAAMLELLCKLCGTETRPCIMRTSYDVPDTYEYCV